MTQRTAWATERFSKHFEYLERMGREKNSDLRDELAQSGGTSQGPRTPNIEGFDDLAEAVLQDLKRENRAWYDLLKGRVTGELDNMARRADQILDIAGAAIEMRERGRG